MLTINYRLLTIAFVATISACASTGPYKDAPEWAEDSVSKLSRYTVDAEFEDAPLWDVVKEIGAQAQVNMVLDPRVYDFIAQTPKVTFNRGTIDCALALQELEKQEGLKGAFVSGAYLITKPELLESFKAAAADYEAKFEKIRENKDSLTSWEKHIFISIFNKSEPGLQEGIDVDTIVSVAALQEKINLWIDPQVYTKLDENMLQVTFLAHEIDVYNLVNLIMIPRGLSFDVAAKGIWIAEPERVEELREKGFFQTVLEYVNNEDRGVREKAESVLMTFAGEIGIEEADGSADYDVVKRNWERWWDENKDSDAVQGVLKPTVDIYE
ncbi:MAG: hypothetical protein NUW37_10885 [Planctomycetes bacterium]|nr:hypothetical protein [Planctomycetota bacterium]